MALICHLSSAASDELVSTVADARGGLWHVAEEMFSNPVVNQWRMTGSLTSIHADYLMRNDNRPIDPRLGKADHIWSGGADTYIKYKSSTLWGAARYANGKCKDMKWNETADASLLYPYLTADSIGGDMQHETYEFGGGYADHAGRWAWGVSLSYKAHLEYRTVDPRPRNVTGTLDVAAGGAYRAWRDYYLALGLNWSKYKQSNDIEFKSEMGVEKIFHLTGLGTHYTRFDGNSLDVNYQGMTFGTDLSIYPSSGRGLFCGVHLSRFTFDNILTDLNKLPMASAWHNSLLGSVGWLQPDKLNSWGVAVNVAAQRRHGTENIFGDPAASIYPQIGALTMYGCNYFSISAKGEYVRHFGEVTRIKASATTGYDRSVEAYVKPSRRTLVSGFSTGAGISTEILLPHAWLLSGGLHAGAVFPTDCAMTWSQPDNDKEMAGLVRIEQNLYRLMSATPGSAGIELALSKPLARKFRLQLEARWTRDIYTRPTHSDRITAQAALQF